MMTDYYDYARRSRLVAWATWLRDRWHALRWRVKVWWWRLCDIL